MAYMFVHSFSLFDLPFNLNYQLFVFDFEYISCVNKF